jgi:hypothetical protein
MIQHSIATTILIGNTSLWKLSPMFVWFTIRLTQFLLVNTSIWSHSPCFIWFTILLSQQSTISIWTQFEPVHQCFILINHFHVSYSYWWTRSSMFMWFTVLLPHQFLLVNTSFCNSSPMFFCNSQLCCHSNSHWWTLYFEPVYLCLMFSMIHHCLVINNSSWRTSYFEPVHWCCLCFIVLLWQQFVGG